MSTPITNQSPKSAIVDWALANPVRALAVGKFLADAFTGKVAKVMPETFDPEQRAVTSWAATNPMTAMFLFKEYGPKINDLAKTALADVVAPAEARES